MGAFRTADVCVRQHQTLVIQGGAAGRENGEKRGGLLFGERRTPASWLGWGVSTPESSSSSCGAAAVVAAVAAALRGEKNAVTRRWQCSGAYSGCRAAGRTPPHFRMCHSERRRSSRRLSDKRLFRGHGCVTSFLNMLAERAQCTDRCSYKAVPTIYAELRNLMQN